MQNADAFCMGTSPLRASPCGEGGCLHCQHALTLHTVLRHLNGRPRCLRQCVLSEACGVSLKRKPAVAGFLFKVCSRFRSRLGREQGAKRRQCGLTCPVLQLRRPPKPARIAAVTRFERALSSPGQMVCRSCSGPAVARGRAGRHAGRASVRRCCWRAVAGQGRGLRRGMGYSLLVTGCVVGRSSWWVRRCWSGSRGLSRYWLEPQAVQGGRCSRLSSGRVGRCRQW